MTVTDLNDAEAFLFDVDGTMVLADDPNVASGGVHVLPRAAEILQLLRRRGKRFAFFTNGTAQVPHAVAAKLRCAGLDIADDEMLTPAVVASEYIRRHHSGQAVLVFGPEGVLEPLRQSGIPLATLTGADHPGVVLIGADVDFGYPKLEAACRAVWAGAPLLVTSMAPFFASRRGRMPSPSGTIAAGIRHATGVEPIVVGKPAPLALEMVAARLGSSPQRVAVVGDDLGLEVRMARDAGAYSVLVLSGVSRESDLAAVPEEYQPHLVVRTVGDLIPRLSGAS